MSRTLALLDTLGNSIAPGQGWPATTLSSPWHRFLGLLSLRKKNSASEPHPSLALLLPRPSECQSPGYSLRRCPNISWATRLL